MSESTKTRLAFLAWLTLFAASIYVAAHVGDGCPQEAVCRAR